MIGRLCGVLLLVCVASVRAVDLLVESHDTFPFPVNETFRMSIVPVRGGPVSTSIGDTLVVLLRSEEDNTELQRSILDFGFKDQIDQPLKGEYVTVPAWAKERDGQLVSLSLQFSRKAHRQWLEVVQLVAASAQERKQLLNDIERGHQVVRVQVSLRVPPRLELWVVSADGREDELMKGGEATAICKALDGIPPSKPVFSGLEGLKVTSDIAAETTKGPERHIKFTVSLQDHRKRLRCSAGLSEIEKDILVLHHPSMVYLEPKPGPLLENGTSLTCLPADGHPTPTLQWILVSGPANASRFFTISSDPMKFHLSSEAPLKSRWIINCSATNTIPGSVAVFNHTVAFVVGRSSEDLTYQIIVGVVVVVVIVLFCLTIVLILCLARKCCAGQTPLAEDRNNGLLPGRALSKDKDLDQEETVPLTSVVPHTCVDPPEIAVSQYPHTNADIFNNCTQNDEAVDNTSVPSESDPSPSPEVVSSPDINISNIPMSCNPVPLESSSCMDDNTVVTVSNLNPSELQTSGIENV